MTLRLLLEQQVVFSRACIEFLGMHCPQEYVSVLYLASSRASLTLRLLRGCTTPWGRGQVKSVTFHFTKMESRMEIYPSKFYSCSGCLSVHHSVETVGLWLVKIDAAGDLTDSWQQSLFLSHIWEVGSLKAKGRAAPMTHFNKIKSIL